MKLKISILLVFLKFGLPISLFGNFYQHIDFYLLALGYLLMAFSFQIVIFNLKMNIPDYWRYISLILSQVYGFILFFLNLAVFDRPTSYQYTIIYDLPFIVSIILIITGFSTIILGIKEEWDENWKITSISASQIIGIVVIILGFIIFENSSPKMALFSSPSTPDNLIAIILIISGILVNVSITGIITITYGVRIKEKSLNFLFIAIIGSALFLLIGMTSFVLEFVHINSFYILFSSPASMYLITSLIFSCIFLVFLIFLNEDILQVTHQIKSLREDDPIIKLSEITQDELEFLNKVDIYTILDLANEDDLEGIVKITKISLDRLKLLREIARKSLSSIYTKI
ncbi:MAG: hypothetical protein ACTSRG_11015 [Candidatus Helarchaeota archaeon]